MERGRSVSQWGDYLHAGYCAISAWQVNLHHAVNHGLRCQRSEVWKWRGQRMTRWKNNRTRKKKREEKWEMLCVWEKERKKEYVFILRWPQWRRWETSLHLPSSLHQSALPSLVFLCSLSLETSIFFRSQCKAEDVNALLVLELHWVISVVYAGLHNEYEFFKRRSVMPFSFPSVC